MRHKRQRINKDQEDTFMTIHEDDHRVEGYSRSQSYAVEGYRTTATSSRSYRDSSNHLHHGDGWRQADLDQGRYSYNEGYGHDEREDYDGIHTRTQGGWGHADSQYGETRNSWSQRYDQGVSVYGESSTWSGSQGSSYGNHSSTFRDQWQSRSERGHANDQWSQEASASESRGDRRRQDWRQEGRDDAVPRFQSDSGWESRRERSWGRDTTARRQERLTDTVHTAEERSWEPSASWQTSTSHQSYPQRSQNNHRSSNSRNKRQNAQSKRRERRGDDNDLNNWTRRDSANSAQSPSKPLGTSRSSRLKHPRSPSYSRSRSRSPAESYRSHRSSRGGRSRSRSSSPVPKRRRRDSSPITLRSRSPSERDPISYPDTRGRYSRSPNPAANARRSPSYGSSRSSERSASRSPVEYTRPIHRLPAMNQTPMTQATSNDSRPREDGRNGVPYNKHGKQTWNKQAAEATSRHERTDRKSNHFSRQGKEPSKTQRSMPPPPSPHHHSHDDGPSVKSPSRYHTARQMQEPPIPQKISTHLPLRSSGFKPVASGSSALKKFFPGDDDDNDHYQGFSPGAKMRDQPHNNQRPGQSGNVNSYSSNENREAYQSLHQDKSDRREVHASPPLHIPMHGEDMQLEDETSKHASVPIPPGHDDWKKSSDYESMAVETQDDSQLIITPLPPVQVQTQEHELLDVQEDSQRELYKILNQVGEGTFGKVYKARNTVSGLHVALKRIRMEAERDGFPVTAMREIKLLQSLRHKNVVQLFEMMVSKGAVYMVFEYMDHDLTGILSQTQFKFESGHLKSLCHQMLAGLSYLHHKGVIHRDIKGSNILINNRGELKLADFGLARFYQKRRRADYTNRVITLWYRPPELLFGATVYGPEVDMWSAGCIMLELFTKKPIFQGNDEIHQLEVIFSILGTPTIERWPDVVHLPWFELVRPRHPLPNKFRQGFQGWMSSEALDLAERLLTYDPSQRITAMDAMSHPYFTREEPSAILPEGLSTLEGEWHELETKKERARKKERKEVT
ncbi:hypothetical protein CVT24_004051 [Panaeolus cyanescens]|uniref:Protein kinase domain-containing protein n=1 Tax=Panaeolus cyanescens TaxID=181874 RepID=A0A409Y6C3_9AGAR|nr:hypothetical protein CVT24_004051 [Panaeolus cyanescens]